MTTDIWFGRQPPATALGAWGARAIYTPYNKQQLDFLPDRQSVRGAHLTKKEFRKVLTELRREVSQRRLDSSDVQVVSRASTKVPGWFYEFSPQGSSGYLYCAIWKGA